MNFRFYFQKILPLNSYSLSLLVGILSLVSYFLSLNVASAATLTLPPNNLGLVGYWPMNEGTSTQAGDFSGFNNHGTLTNMDANTDWVNGKHGKALDFDGSDDWLDIGDRDVFTFNTVTGMTVSAWIKRTGFGNMTILSKDGLLSECDADIQEYVLGIVDGDIYFWVSQDGNNYIGRIDTDYINDNNWHHIVGVWDGGTTSSAIKIYIDRNQSDDSNFTTGTFTSMTNTARSLTIGKESCGSGPYFNGLIDDVRIYNRALSADEVARLYESGQVTRKISNTGLVGYWPLNEGTSTIAGDFSGNRNHGTLTNMDANTDWVNGKRGKALDFDGSDDYVGVPHSSSLDITGPFTISIFANWNSLISQGGIESGLVAKGAISDEWSRYALAYAGNDGSIYLYSGNGSNSSILSNTKVVTGRWYHIVGVLRGTDTNEAEIWINGVKTGEGTLPLPTSVSRDLFLGRWRSGHDSANVKLDDVRIYNRALSAAEIMDIYKSGEVTVNTSFKNRITNGLVGMWTFNGNDMNWTSETAGQAYDRSGQNNTGTLTNMTRGFNPTIGRLGQGLQFDGVDDYVNIGSPASLVIGTNSQTITAWVKTTFVSPTVHASIYASDGLLANHLVTFYVASSTKVRLNVRDGDGDEISNGFFDGTTSVNNDQWRFVAGVWDASNDTASIYVDGIIDATASGLSSIGNVNNNSTHTIGKDFVLGGNYFKDKLDDVRIYNRALSPEEIRQLYLMGK